MSREEEKFELTDWNLRDAKEWKAVYKASNDLTESPWTLLAGNPDLHQEASLPRYKRLGLSHAIKTAWWSGINVVPLAYTSQLIFCHIILHGFLVSKGGFCHFYILYRSGWCCNTNAKTWFLGDKAYNPSMFKPYRSKPAELCLNNVKCILHMD